MAGSSTATMVRDDPVMNVPNMAGAPNPAEKDGDEEAFNDDEQVKGIVQRLELLADEQVTAKSDTEERWLRNLRAFHGVYDPTTETRLKDSKKSRAFIKATRAKTISLEAKLYDLLFPTDDKNWGIKPTPVPKLSKEGKEAATRAQNAADQANIAEEAGNPDQAAQIVEEGNDEASRALAAAAEIATSTKAAESMQDEMEDQLIESKYPKHCRMMIRDGCKLGTGILKGPMVNESTRGAWMRAKDADGNVTENFELIQREDPRPLITRTDPWAFFPDMSASCIDEAEFTFERYLWTKKNLRKMVRTHNFNKASVRRILDDDRQKRPSASKGLTNLSKLRDISGEGEDVIKGRYVGWEYHGPLECEEVVALLRATGEDEIADEYEADDDPLKEFNVICYFCDGELLKIAPEYPLDSGETLYSVFNLEETEGSIFGYGIPEIMADSQNAANSSWRMGLDNAALSIGPQTVIDKEQVIPQDGNWRITANKVWLRVKAGVKGDKPVEFFNIPNNMKEISTLVQMALDFVDMETGLPMPQQGEQGAHTTQTFGGMAILQNASTVIFRRFVKNFDDGVITPTMRRLYDWNMQFNPRTEIKGDMSIDARGSSVLLVKEVQAQNLIFVVSQLLSNPNIEPMLKPYENVRKLFQSMLISPDEVMHTADDYEKELKARAEADQPEQNPAVINAQSRIEAAKIAAQSRQLDGQVSLEIEQTRQQTALIELGLREKLGIEDIKAKLSIEGLKIDNKERMMATEIGAEEVFADKARANGEIPGGSGGFVSASGGEDDVSSA